LPFRWHFSGKLVPAAINRDKSMSALENPIYRFKEFELEPAERRLSAAGKPIALTPKVFDTLVLLVARAGHVVSKDELMKALWPRGYVDESNLTKHVWFIRRALGDDDQASRFIETVPKVGYRFVAPVTTSRHQPEAAPAPAPPAPAELTAAVANPHASPAPALPVAPPPSESGLAGPTLARIPRALIAHWWIWVLAIVAGTALVALAWHATVKPTASPITHHGRTVALVGFANLSGEAKDAWLAPALAEMLGAELNAGDLQVVPDELVRDARADLAQPAAGGYAPDTLARLRRRLDADYVVSGSYLITGSSESAPMRIDVAVQDARSGALISSVSNQSSLSGLIGLASQVGVALRGKLGISPPAAAALGRVANAEPPSVDVARRIGFALDALQHYDAARARDELVEAIAEAPGYAPAYTYLAQAWSDLGYRDKALAAAGKAADYSANLPPELRLQAEAVFASLRADGAKATLAWQTLVRLRPTDAEYRLRLIDAQIAAGTAAQAQATLAELRRQSNLAGDPRIELAAARIASATDDAKGSADHAALALREARDHDAAGLTADAQVSLAGAQMHLSQNEEARGGLLAAIAGYHAIRNPRGEANARRSLAQVLTNLNRAQEAREEYQRALALYQSIGDVGGVASVYRDQCEMLWLAGDQDGAKTAARHGLEIARETGDLFLQAWTLRALATIASDEASSDEVLSEYREVIALNERSGNRGGHVWSLAAYADVERLRGNLDEAAAYCVRAIQEAALLSDPQFVVFSGYTCALVRVDRGEDAAARAALQEVERRSTGNGRDGTYGNAALMTLAQLDMDESRWSAARERLIQVSQVFAAAEEPTGEAQAQAMLALCAQSLRDTAARDAASERAHTLRQSITSRQEVYGVDIALAQLAGETGQDTAAVGKLLGLAAEAERRQWLGWSLEAKVSAWKLLRARGASAAGALRAEIETTARHSGFGRIVSLVQQADADATGRAKPARD
jgi:DNA-binding winged helix-turn-helix (wHTH) protein/tetratricopeptide (TPR) repeat protein